MESRITVTIASGGYQGNIYSILAAVRTAMRKRSLIQAYNDIYFDVTNSESYAAAIARIRQDVDLVDTDGKI
jgi:hypothetical protein